MAGTTYDAFISYSHKDMYWGRWIQERTERYRIPRQLREESEAAGRNLRVFRDQTDLAGVELQASLQRELEASRYMIVICSPNSASSPWVNEEIRYFKSLGRADRIIPFIVDGEPESGRAETECYPEELRNDADHHFMGANVREIGRNKTLLKVISICLGIRFDRLADRDRQRRHRNALLAGSALFLVAATFIGLLWRNMNIAQENARVSKEREQIALENERIAKENEQMALEREQVALENERIAKENEAIARENERIAQENERIAQENQALIYDNYIAAMLPIVQQGYASAEDVARVEASANAGNLDAVFMMGYMTEHGLYQNEPDPDAAYVWYLRGAEAGSPVCMAAAGAYLLVERDSDEDRQAGYAWTRQAAETGQTSSMYSVGICLESGMGTEKNEAEAFTWYLRAAEGGFTDAYDNVISCYLQGIGIEPDAGQAFEWIRKLAATGSAAGMRVLGLCYLTGYVTEADPREAYLWYRRSAEAGDPDGMYWTGWCLENHYGVDSEAEEWYRRAAELGQADAAEALERFR